METHLKQQVGLAVWDASPACWGELCSCWCRQGVFCALLEKISFFVNFLPYIFVVFFGLVYCSIVLAFVPHLEYLFLFVLGSVIVVFFQRSQCSDRWTVCCDSVRLCCLLLVQSWRRLSQCFSCVRSYHRFWSSNKRYETLEICLAAERVVVLKQSWGRKIFRDCGGSTLSAGRPKISYC